MTNSKKTRALNAFAAMSRIPDDYVLAAERMLQEAEAGISRPQKPMGGFRRFLNSGWGAAVISGIVALAVLAFIIHAGVNPPATYEPPVKPAGSTIEMSTEGVNYTIATELEHYPKGATDITAVLTGKAKGESISTAGGGWHLERLTADRAEVVEIIYPCIAQMHEPHRDEYATLVCSMTALTPLASGTYRLHATKHDGEKYVSVAWCEFTVGEIVSESESESERESETEAEAVTSPEAPKLPFTVTLTKSIYTTRDTALSVRFRANKPGVPLSRGDCWSLYRMEDGEHIHLGSQIAEYGIEGEEVAPDEYAEEDYALSIKTATGGGYETLSVGKYKLVFDVYGMAVSFEFEVADFPEDTGTCLAYYLSSGLLIFKGSATVAAPFSADGYPVSYEGLTDGDLVEICMGNLILETWPCQIKVYAVRKISDGTIDNIPADLLEQLKEYGWYQGDD